MGNIIQKLQELGYRLTPQRMMVITALEGSDIHISAEELWTRVRAQYPLMNISTIYRTLKLLEELGLVTETDLGEGKVRYHTTEKGHHHHLVCRKCGEITDLDEKALLPLENVLREQYGFAADLRHLALFGYCLRCAGEI